MNRVPHTDRRFDWLVFGAGTLGLLTGIELLILLPGHIGAGVGLALVATGTVAAVVPVVRHTSGAGPTTAVLTRWTREARKHGGTASTWDHLQVSSRWAMRSQAVTLRPSLADVSRWQRFRTPVTEYATPLAKVGRHTVWSPCEDVTLRLGGPRTGKSGELACRIVDAPGAVIATSTRTDLVELTAACRARIGPVAIFNPSGLAGWASTMKWSPLVGCRIPGIAARRAQDMIPTATGTDSERWDVQARRVLAMLLHAAALQSLSMRSVLAWVSDPGPKSAQQVEKALERSPEARAMTMAAAQFFTINERTKTSITATIMPALSWLTDTRAATVGDAPVDELLDVASLLDQRGTLYLLGAEDGVVAPLVAALTAEIAHAGRMLAAGGRLDPPLTIALDEAAIICPVPLDRWTADFGGKNITLHISIQSRSQLRQRWGDAGAGTILNNTASILVYGGVRDPGDLEAWSKLCGEREESGVSLGLSGKETGSQIRKVPILSGAQIANLPKGYAVVIRRGMPVSIGVTTMAWNRRDIRRINKASPFVPTLETDFEADGKGGDDGNA